MNILKLASVVVFLFLISCQSNKKETLYIFNWTDYIAPELLVKFEEEHNCKVVYDTYNSNENMLTRVMNSTAAYDIVFPSADHVVILREYGLLEKLDKSKLPGLQNLDPLINLKVDLYDNNMDYSVPYFWGTTGLLYNKQKLPDTLMKDVSWNIIADNRFTGKNIVTLLDDSRSVLGAALIYKGFSFNDMSDAALNAARTVLLEWDKNVSQYDSDSYKNEIQDGTTWLAQGYNGDALQIMAENENVGFVLPKEGAELWIDSFVMLKNSENKELAYKFINFMLDPENAKLNAEYVQYATPNLGAHNLLDDETKNNSLIYPSDEYLEKCEILLNVGKDILKVNKIWEEIRNN